MQACKAFTFQASRSKKESGVSDRNIIGLMDGEAYLSEAGSQSDTHYLHGRVGGGLLVTGGIDIRQARQLPGKPAEGHTTYNPFEKLVGTITSWVQGQVSMKVSQSCEWGVGEAGTGQAGNVQRAEEQPS